MGIGASVLLVALGAVLTWAVDGSIGGIDINVIGAILMVAGVGGLLVFFTVWNSQSAPKDVIVVRQLQDTEQPSTSNDTARPQQTAPVPAASHNPRHGD